MGGLQVLLVGQVIERHLKFDSLRKLEQPLNQTRSAPTAGETQKHQPGSLVWAEKHDFEAFIVNSGSRESFAFLTSDFVQVYFNCCWLKKKDVEVRGFACFSTWCP